MLGAARPPQAFAGSERDDMVAELDAQPAFPYQEELVLVLVVVPGKLARDLDEFDLLAIERGNDLGAPMLGEVRELFVEMEFFGHRTSLPPPPPPPTPPGRPPPPALPTPPVLFSSFVRF